jgi:ribosomal protein S27AE
VASISKWLFFALKLNIAGGRLKMFCPNCNVLMKKSKYEYYCFQCGHVIDDYIVLKIKTKISKYELYYSWKCNFKQTLNETKIINGRHLLKIKEMCPVRC